MASDSFTFSSKTLSGVLLALSLGLAVAAGVAWQDAGNRQNLEHICLPTGLGVDQYVHLPEPLEFQSELARFGGQPVYAASLNIRELPESDLEVLVSGVAGEPPVFRRHQPGTAKTMAGQQEHFLKVGSDAYLRVHQGPDREAFAGGKVGCVARH